MGITFYRDHSNLAHVRFGRGDVLLQALQGRHSGAVGLLLFDGPAGEIGRDMSELDPAETPDIRTHDTVLLSFSDPRSIDVVIEALKRMKERLVQAPDTAEKAVFDGAMESLRDEEDKEWIANIAKHCEPED